MREVKEKSPLKERTVKTLKSAPQAAFRRGTDASFQQLRQELRDAAQGGQPEDRYESSKITDTADHAVQEVRHLAEKAAHRLPKTKSEPQREARTESVPQHEQSRQPTTAPREYPPQSQSQVSRSVRESASPIREKPIPPANAQQPKTRVYTPDAKAPASPSQYPTSEIHEKPQTVHQSQKNRSVRELETSVREKPAGKARPAEQRSLGQSPASTEPPAPATTPTVQPSARTLPREKRLFRLCMNSLSHPKRIPHSSRFLQSRRKSTSERSGKNRIFSKKKQAVLRTQSKIPKLFLLSFVHGKLFVNSKNSTFPIVRSRSSQLCLRSERGSRRQLPCPPI